MNEGALGDELCALCAIARDELVIVAPFIKHSSLRRLLAHVDPSVRVSCITRWHPAEVLAGVSDIEIYELLAERERATLSLVANLHAKFYRADSQCLIGSANVTNTALGWLPNSNLELLVPLASNMPLLVRFEAEASRRAVVVSRSVFDEYRDAVELLRRDLDSPEGIHPQNWPSPAAGLSVSEDAESDSSQSMANWIPASRHPENVFLVYGGEGARLTAAGAADATRDLDHLCTPVGLSKRGLHAWIRLELVQSRLVQALDSYLSEPRRFGAIREWLRGYSPAEEHTPTERWQRLMRWLLYFCADRYGVKTANYSEVFYRRK